MLNKLQGIFLLKNLEINTIDVATTAFNNVKITRSYYIINNEFLWVATISVVKCLIKEEKLFFLKHRIFIYAMKKLFYFNKQELIVHKNVVVLKRWNDVN